MSFFVSVQKICCGCFQHRIGSSLKQDRHSMKRLELAKDILPIKVLSKTEENFVVRIAVLTAFLDHKADLRLSG